jgi:hypothetical protein
VSYETRTAAAAAALRVYLDTLYGTMQNGQPLRLCPDDAIDLGIDLLHWLNALPWEPWLEDEGPKEAFLEKYRNRVSDQFTTECFDALAVKEDGHE